MTSLSLASPPNRTVGASRKIALGLCLIVFGDWLFFGRNPGISAALFLATLAAATFAARRHDLSRRDGIIAASILFASMLPLLEDVNPLSVIFGTSGTALFAAVVSGALEKGIRTLSATAAATLLVGPFRAGPEILRSIQAPRSDLKPRFTLTVLMGWIAPLLLCGVFAFLFSQANPLFEQAISALAPTSSLSEVTFLRALLWAALLGLVWSFLNVHLRTVVPSTWKVRLHEGADRSASRLFDTTVILRSLVMFNLLFAAQTGLDAVYLWGGKELPPGIDYAAYAQRGAYPLVATALLAAVFVLATLHPNGPGDHSRPIRLLVFAWIGQNILLVVSAIARLNLYVGHYSLTMLRLAAFIWMALVAVGLILIIARIVLRRSNTWLINANAIALTATLYICAFVNFPAVIATYNFEHSLQAQNAERGIDAFYMLSLGPQALPTLDRYLEDNLIPASDPRIVRRNSLASAHHRLMADWRAWTYRGWRLQQYLAMKEQNRVGAPAAGI